MRMQIHACARIFSWKPFRLKSHNFLNISQLIGVLITCRPTYMYVCIYVYIYTHICNEIHTQSHEHALMDIVYTCRHEWSAMITVLYIYIYIYICSPYAWIRVLFPLIDVIYTCSHEWSARKLSAGGAS